MRVKICGITNLRDAEAAIDMGADALGFIFAPSPRRVSVDVVRKIVRRVGPYVASVGVFVDASVTDMLRVARRSGINTLQLHGDEKPGICPKLAPYPIIKTFRMRREFSLSAMTRYAVNGYLIETDQVQRGGTGEVWDWHRFGMKKTAKSLIVSGGLNVGNVRRAIRILRPYAVDVSSGIERSAGRKDHRLMEKFIRYAKSI